MDGYLRRIRREAWNASIILLLGLLVQDATYPDKGISAIIIFFLFAAVLYWIITDYRVKKGYFGNNEAEARIILEEAQKQQH